MALLACLLLILLNALLLASLPPVLCSVRMLLRPLAARIPDAVRPQLTGPVNAAPQRLPPSPFPPARFPAPHPTLNKLGITPRSPDYPCARSRQSH
jgi:hypothetical protein